MLVYIDIFLIIYEYIKILIKWNRINEKNKKILGWYIIGNNYKKMYRGDRLFYLK